MHVASQLLEEIVFSRLAPCFRIASVQKLVQCSESKEYSCFKCSTSYIHGLMLGCAYTYIHLLQCRKGKVLIYLVITEGFYGFCQTPDLATSVIQV